MEQGSWLLSVLRHMAKKTTGTFETYMELKYYVDNPSELDIIPVQMCYSWPPLPPGPEEGRDLCNYVFNKSRVRLDGTEQTDAGERIYMDPVRLAEKIYDHIKGLGLLAEVKCSLPGPRSCSVPETAYETVSNMKVSDPHILSGLDLDTLLDDGQTNLGCKSLGAGQRPERARWIFNHESGRGCPA